MYSISKNLKSVRYLPHNIANRIATVKIYLNSFRYSIHNDKVERSHRNNQERFDNHLKFYSMEDLHLQPSRYLKRSNNIPMSVLNYLTPKEM